MGHVLKIAGYPQLSSFHSIWIGKDIQGAYDVFTLANLTLLSAPSKVTGIDVPSQTSSYGSDRHDNRRPSLPAPQSPGNRELTSVSPFRGTGLGLRY